MEVILISLYSTVPMSLQQKYVQRSYNTACCAVFNTTVCLLYHHCHILLQLNFHLFLMLINFSSPILFSSGLCRLKLCNLDKAEIDPMLQKRFYFKQRCVQTLKSLSKSKSSRLPKGLHTAAPSSSMF